MYDATVNGLPGGTSNGSSREFVPDRLVNPLRVARRRREQVDDQQIDPLIQDVGRFLDERPQAFRLSLFPGDTISMIATTFPRP